MFLFKAENTIKLNAVCRLLTSEKFLTALLTDPEYKEERTQLKTHIFTLLKLSQNAEEKDLMPTTAGQGGILNRIVNKIVS